MSKKPDIQKGNIHPSGGSFEGVDILCPKCQARWIFQKNDEPEPIHDEIECLKVRSKCGKCQTPFGKDSNKVLCEGVGYVCQSCYAPYEGLPSGVRGAEISGGSYVGEEGFCPECNSTTNYVKGENNPPLAFKCKDEKSCLQLQKEKLERLRENKRNGYTLTSEEQAELSRLEQKLGVSSTPDYSPASESNKKELEWEINNLQKGVEALKQLPKNHPGFSEYDWQKMERKLTELKKEYKYKYGELPSSLRDSNDSPQRERERESNFAIWDTAIREYNQ
jgi:hypothetical protein